MAIQSERAQIDGSINIDGSIFQYQVEFTGGSGGGGGGDVGWSGGSVGSNNELITAAGDGSIVAESQMTYAGSYLEINKPAGATAYLGDGVRSAGRAELGLFTDNSAGVSEIQFGWGARATDNSIRWAISDRGTTTPYFYIYEAPGMSGAGWIQRIAIEGGTGYVGINDATPSYQLDVNGTGRFTSTLTAPGVTSGADPGHTHTGTSISALDTGDITTGTLSVERGGTGLATIGTNYMLTGNGTSAITAESALTFDGNILEFDSAADKTIRMKAEASSDATPAALNILGATGSGHTTTTTTTSSPTYYYKTYDGFDGGDILIKGGTGADVAGTSHWNGSYYYAYDGGTGGDLLLQGGAAGSAASPGEIGNVNLSGTVVQTTSNYFDVAYRLRHVGESDNYIEFGSNSQIFHAGHPTYDVLRLSGLTGAVINEDGINGYDFRVESKDYTHMLFVESSSDRIGINQSNPAHTLDVVGTMKSSGRAYTGGLTTTQHIYGTTSTVDVGGSSYPSETFRHGYFTGTVYSDDNLSLNWTSTPQVLDANDYGIYTTSHVSLGQAASATTDNYELSMIGQQANYSSGTNLRTVVNAEDLQYISGVQQTDTHGFASYHTSSANDYHYNYYKGAAYGGNFHRQGTSNSDLRQEWQYLRYYVSYNSGTSNSLMDITSAYSSTPGYIAFNDAGLDMDFRIESDDNAYMFFIDGGNNFIGINESTPNVALDVNGAIRVEATQSPAQGEGLEIHYNSATPSASIFPYNRTGSVYSAPLDIRGAPLRLRGGTVDTATMNYGIDLSATEVVVNNEGIDMDFRIEGTSSNDYAFFVRGLAPSKVGMGEMTTETQATYKMLNLRFYEGNSAAKLTSVGAVASDDSFLIMNDYTSVSHASIDFVCDTNTVSGYNAARFGFYGYYSTNADLYNYFFWTGGNSTTTQWETMRLQRTGILSVRSDVVAYSTVITSDERLKKNIENLEDDILDKIMQLRPVTFEWKDESKRGDDRVSGLIAQEVEEIFPELISESTNLDDNLEDGEEKDETEYKHVRYNELVPYLTKATQIQQKTINDQQKEIDDLKEKMSQILEKLS